MVWYGITQNLEVLAQELTGLQLFEKVCKFVTEEEKDKKFNKFRSFNKLISLKFPICFNNFPICFNKFPIILAGSRLALSDPPNSSTAKNQKQKSFFSSTFFHTFFWKIKKK